MAILGILALLVTLSEPVAALAVKAPCHEAMAEMAMADDMAPCKSVAKACLAAGNCQSQCGSTVPFVGIASEEPASPLFTMTLHMAVGQQPPGTDSPVDGPPPRT